MRKNPVAQPHKITRRTEGVALFEQARRAGFHKRADVRAEDAQVGMRQHIGAEAGDVIPAEEIAAGDPAPGGQIAGKRGVFSAAFKRLQEGALDGAEAD